MKKRIVRLTESDLRRIITESVRSVLLKEDDIDSARKQREVKEMAIQALSDAGYNDLWGSVYDDNDYMLAVRVRDDNEISRIERSLSRALGIKNPFDLSVTLKTNMVGGDARAVIRLPSWTHL